MNKIVCLAVFLVVYGPISAYADCSLQKLAFVLKNRKTAKLGSYDCVPAVSNDGVSTQYVTYTVDTTDNPSDVYNTIVQYMANAVGDAQSSYDCNGNQFKITYVGDYDPALKEPTKVQSLIEVLSTFDRPILGNIECEKGYSKITRSGFAYVSVIIPLNGNSAATQCKAAWKYLSESGYLDNLASNTCYKQPNRDSALLEIWSPSSNFGANKIVCSKR